MIDDAQHQSIIDALNSWDRDVTEKHVAEATALREEFVDRFPISAWPTMPVEDYALGQGNNDVVSYWLEFKTKPIASMSGGSSHKHLIFKRAVEDVWQYPKEYTSIEQAWNAVRTGFVEILEMASQGQFDDTDDVKVLTGAQAARTKLLYLYFPDDLIPVTSKEAHRPLPAIARRDAAPVGGSRQPSAARRTACDARTSRVVHPGTRLLRLPLGRPAHLDRRS